MRLRILHQKLIMSTIQNDVFAEHQIENCDKCEGQGEVRKSGSILPCECTLSNYPSAEEND